MCKYCKLTEADNSIGEQTTEWGDLVTLKDGSLVASMYLFRDIIDPLNERTNELGIDLSFKVGESLYPIKCKNIKIKYCPFCGEEL